MNHSYKITTFMLAVTLLVAPVSIAGADTPTKAEESTALKLAQVTRRCFESAGALALLAAAAYVMPTRTSIQSRDALQSLVRPFAFIGALCSGFAMAMNNVQYDTISTTEEESDIKSIASMAKNMGAFGLATAGAIISFFAYNTLAPQVTVS